MGVKVLAFIALLVISVYGQENDITNDVVEDNIISDDTTFLETSTEKVEIKEDEIEEVNPVEILSATDGLQVRSGKYQLSDGLVGEEPLALDAVDFNANNEVIQSEKQLLSPGTTQVTNNEYGKSFNWYNSDINVNIQTENIKDKVKS